MPLVLAEEIIAGKVRPHSIDLVSVSETEHALRIRCEGRTFLVGRDETLKLVRRLYKLKPGIAATISEVLATWDNEKPPKA